MGTDEERDPIRATAEPSETSTVARPDTVTASPRAPVPDPPRGRALIAQWSVVWTILMLLFAAILVLQNVDDVRIDFLFWTVTVPLAAALLLTLAAGGLIASLIALVRQHQYRRALQRSGRSRQA
jgi:uncharacterized integral membrane protein